MLKLSNNRRLIVIYCLVVGDFVKYLRFNNLLINFIKFETIQ